MANKPKSDTHVVVPGGGLAKEVNLLALSGEIGWKLAVPIVFFVILGVKLDRAYHTAPLFILIGIALSLTVSALLIARMIARVGR